MTIDSKHVVAIGNKNVGTIGRTPKYCSLENDEGKKFYTNSHNFLDYRHSPINYSCVWLIFMYLTSLPYRQIETSICFGFKFFCSSHRKNVVTSHFLTLL